MAHIWYILGTFAIGLFSGWLTWPMLSQLAQNLRSRGSIR